MTSSRPSSPRADLGRTRSIAFAWTRNRCPRASTPADYAGVIIGGGPSCVSRSRGQEIRDREADGRMTSCRSCRLLPSRTCPFSAACYGIGILAHHLGAEVGKNRYSEPVSAVTCRVMPDGKNDPLVQDLPETFRAFVGHKEAVQETPCRLRASPVLSHLPLSDDPLQAERLTPPSSTPKPMATCFRGAHPCLQRQGLFPA